MKYITFNSCSNNIYHLERSRRPIDTESGETYCGFRAIFDSHCKDKLLKKKPKGKLCKNCQKVYDEVFLENL